MGRSLGRSNLLEINYLAVFQKMQSEAERTLNSAKAITGLIVCVCVCVCVCVYYIRHGTADHQYRSCCISLPLGLP